MSAERKPRADRAHPPTGQEEEFVRVPTVIDPNGDKVVTLFDAHGRPHTRLVAETVLEAFVGPRPTGHVARFKDGDRLNCAQANLEWAPVHADPPADPARDRMLSTRRRAEESRRALAGRPQSDSAELLAEDRLR